MSKLTIYGATGLVGTLTAQYLHSLGLEDVILAGRDRDKLEALRTRLNPQWEVLLADANDTDNLELIVRKSRVVIAVAGPYQLYGNAVVDLCAQMGVDYVDLTGEVPFIRRSIDNNHAQATESGARIIHSCGFDSVPSDMGMFNLYQAAQEPFTRVDMVVDELVGGISAGTLESARQISAAAEKDPAVARLLGNRYSLNPNPKAPETHTEYQPDFLIENLPQIGWVGPFFMAAFNTRVVRRSNALLDNAWGENLRYREGWATGHGKQGHRKAILMGLVTKALFQGSRNKLTRPLVESMLPQPGIKDGRFQVSHYGRTQSGKTWRSVVSATGDPGYEVTAKMLAQAAMTLLETSGPGGVWTPASGLGKPYQSALEKAGLNFSAELLEA